MRSRPQQSLQPTAMPSRRDRTWWVERHRRRSVPLRPAVRGCPMGGRI